MHMRRCFAGGILIVGLLASAGCAGTPSSVGSASATATSTSPQVDRPAVDADTIRGPGLSVDFDASPSVAGVVSRNKVAFSGTVKGWRDGRTIESGPKSQYKTQILSAVLVVAVDTSYGGTPVTGNAYVQVVRGMFHSDSSGNIDRSRYTYREVTDLEKAAPVGVRVTVIGVPAATDEALAQDGDVITPAPDVPADADVFQVDPQGLLFEDADGSYVSGYAPDSDVIVGDWPGADGTDTPPTYDALLSALRSTSAS